MGFADLFGHSRVPLLVLNVTHPLVPSQIESFCAGKRAVLIVEEGAPEFIEQAIQTILRRADLQTDVFGKGVLAGGRAIHRRSSLQGDIGVP
jgi:indolepyruvate ferredoxin oxidoreductase alpha subunit